MLRSSKHNLQAANSGKKENLAAFLKEMRSCIQFCIDYLWILETENWNTSKDILNLPQYLDYKDVPFEENLSARAICSALNQAISIVRSSTQKKKQLLFILNKLQNEKKDTTYIKKQVDKFPLVKPNISKDLSIELSSKCIDIEFESNHFDAFLRIKSTGYEHIRLPIKFTKSFKKRKDWKLLGGVSLHEDYITLRQEIETPELKTEGKIVGADTGILSTITLSDGQVSKNDIHGHDLSSITDRLARKKKGSKSFERTQEHRKNYVNWTINTLNLENISQINLEKINTFTGVRNRKLSHFAHSLISRKLELRCEENGVRLSLQSCTYKSQRCSGCGMVRKANRKGKLYKCKNCKVEIDADLNSAINNSQELPAISYAFRQQGLNRKGFFWKEEGFFDLAGQEFEVPDTYKKI